MMHTLFALYAASPLGVAIRNSSWAFAVIEMFHLAALAALGGVLFVGGLGLMGLAFQFPGRTQAWRGLRPLLGWSFVAILISGVLLVGSNPMKYYFNDAFRAKILLLSVGILATLAVERAVSHGALLAARLLAPIVLLLWLGVALAGRLIGLL